MIICTEITASSDAAHYQDTTVIRSSFFQRTLSRENKALAKYNHNIFSQTFEHVSNSEGEVPFLSNIYA